MKSTTTKAILVFTIVLMLTTSLLDRTMADDDSSFCDPKCAARCSKAGRQDRCLKYCRICCKKCHCVPSGTYGNKDECPCYRDMKNSKGNPKCP
ncbi:hypothetical protein CDL12_16007 [Handroanthus impetiginosus]|uniref:Gibberellin regulated protein n=1 Tax=Handroanthus impetiginosus TaxID=429701 RepID=A0A2G9H1K3_9LAMI|nr:hypothetical protein CDL12_16007 [Handroanthus impetiginosus]